MVDARPARLHVALFMLHRQAGPRLVAEMAAVTEPDVRRIRSGRPIPRELASALLGLPLHPVVVQLRRRSAPRLPMLEDFLAETWRILGACRDVADPSIFYPGRGESTAEAQAVCRGCPVRTDCLESALVHGEKHGIWGGTSERQRRRIRRQRRLG